MAASLRKEHGRRMIYIGHCLDVRPWEKEQQDGEDCSKRSCVTTTRLSRGSINGRSYVQATINRAFYWVSKRLLQSENNSSWEHTCGSMILLETRTNSIFLWDVQCSWWTRRSRNRQSGKIGRCLSNRSAAVVFLELLESAALFCALLIYS
jgi:hypothetical protein